MTPTRREYMAGVAALAATRWDGEDYDIEDVDEWEPLDGGVFRTGKFTPADFSTSGEGVVTGWLLEEDRFDERAVEVTYARSGVYLSMEGSTESGEIFSGSGASLDPDTARELGAALYQAAEEFERRPKAERERGDV